MVHSPALTGPIFSSLCCAWAGASGVLLISGGYRRYSTSGVASKAVRAGTQATLSHVSQGEGSCTPSEAASFKHSKFWAAAVRNRAEEFPAFCSGSGMVKHRAETKGGFRVRHVSPETGS